MKIHFILHEAFEGPGAITEWATDKGHHVSFTHRYQNEVVPPHADDMDFLIVLGGSQTPATTLYECAYFDAKAEIALIKQAIEQDKKVLGICLGAQLIGEALGAKYQHSPHKEIGVFPISLTAEAKEDAIFSNAPNTFSVGHWHGDMPGLPVGAVVLACSEGCPRQIVKFSDTVYGFQCHFEFTPESIEAMIQNCAHELEASETLPYVQDATTLRQNDYTSINQRLFEFLERFTQQ